MEFNVENFYKLYLFKKNIEEKKVVFKSYVSRFNGFMFDEVVYTENEAVMVLNKNNVELQNQIISLLELNEKCINVKKMSIWEFYKFKNNE